MAAAGIAFLACPEAARPPATDTGSGGSSGGDGATGGSGGSAAPPQVSVMNWPITEADFGDDALSQTSNRSKPFAWDRIAADKVLVSIDGHELPFENTSANPVFPSDTSGAEWTVTPDVRAGAVEIVLTAKDLSGATDTVTSVTITNPGSGYTSVPTVTFAGGGGAGAAATAVMAGSVTAVAVTDPAWGSYETAPTVTIAPPAGGTTATATVATQMGVGPVTITNPGSGYTAAPTVTIAAPPAGTTATATAALQSGVSSVAGYSAGSGYTSPPTVTFAAPPTGGVTATAYTSLDVASVTVTNGGIRLHVCSSRYL